MEYPNEICAFVSMNRMAVIVDAGGSALGGGCNPAPGRRHDAETARRLGLLVGLSGCVDPGTAGRSHQNGETYDILSLVRSPVDFAAFRRRFGGACLSGPMRMCQVVYVEQSSRPGATAVTRRLAAVELQDGQICRVSADSRAGEARFFGAAMAGWRFTISKPFEVPPGEDWLDRGLEACAVVAPIAASATPPGGVRRAGP